MYILNKVIYIFNHTSAQLGKMLLTFVQIHKWSQIVKIILNKKNKAGSIILSDCKMNYKSRVIKTAWDFHKRDID